MITLFTLPLEKYEERYTGQWYRWFADEFMKYGIRYQYIDGEQLTTSVETGVVLDAAGTNSWKFTQLAKVCQLFKDRKVRDGDIFFTMDLWHPGLEAIPYMAELYRLNVKLYGFLHAGSYTTEDFASPMAPWAQYFEKGWAAICDGIFVGSHYHRNKFSKVRLSELGLNCPVRVTGNPFSTSELLSVTGPLTDPWSRLKKIIYPNRFDREKRPDIFMQLMEILWEQRQDFEVVFTTSRPTFRSNDPGLLRMLEASSFKKQVKAGITKEQYYRELADSRIYVSTTIEENFGYCLVEAMACNTIPVVVDDYSHQEILDFDDRFLYKDVEDALLKLNLYLDADFDNRPFELRDSLTDKASYYDGSIYRMLEIMEVV